MDGYKLVFGGETGLLEGYRTGVGIDVKGLERKAIESPESREMIVSLLNNYAYRYRGTGRGKAARSAVKRITVISMLEILSEEEPV